MFGGSLLLREVDLEHPKVLDDVFHILTFKLELVCNSLYRPLFGMQLVIGDELDRLSKCDLPAGNFLCVWFVISKVVVSRGTSTNGKWFLRVDFASLINLKENFIDSKQFQKGLSITHVI